MSEFNSPSEKFNDLFFGYAHWGMIKAASARLRKDYGNNLNVLGIEAHTFSFWHFGQMQARLHAQAWADCDLFAKDIILSKQSRARNSMEYFSILKENK